MIALRLLAIGDAHGCATSLKALVRRAKITEQDTLVMLGDYIDRGPDSKGVLDFLCELRHRTNLIPLLGNHEVMLLEALQSTDARKGWIHGVAGGKATLDSYGAFLPTAIPAEHIQFIKRCVRWHEAESHFFVHANAKPELDLKNQDDTILLWDAVHRAPARHKSGKTMICGHVPQDSGIPKNWGTAVCIDTGTGYGGWLTCLDVRSGGYWQANEKGESRAGLRLREPDTDATA